MKAPLQTASRLLGAVEHLVEQEGFLLRARAYAQAAAVRERINPLVAELCALGAGGALAQLQRRFQLLVARRREHLSALAERREALVRERSRLTEMRGRLGRLRAYSHSRLKRLRLDAAV